MADSTLWWLLAGSAIALELFTGTFYLLMLALGAAAAALTAHLGFGGAAQMVAAAIVGGAGWYFLSGDTAELDIAEVSGPSPVISAPRKEIFPTINVADVEVWADGEAPEARRVEIRLVD